MLLNLIDPNFLIEDSLNVIRSFSSDLNMHIVSGSDQKELRQICNDLEISKYFISIHGSPTPKKQLVKDLLFSHEYEVSQTVLIGDSINDYEAAKDNKISFFGYNNMKLKEEEKKYIEKFSL